MDYNDKLSLQCEISSLTDTLGLDNLNGTVQEIIKAFLEPESFIESSAIGATTIEITERGFLLLSLIGEWVEDTFVVTGGSLLINGNEITL